MNIRNKIAVIVAAVSLGLFISSGFLMGLFYFDMLNRQETQDVANKCVNLVNYLQGQYDTLLSTMNDWAKWDDTFAFITDKRPEYIQLNLNADSVNQLDMSFIVFYDETGREVHSLYFNRETRSLTAFPKELMVSVADGMADEFQKNQQYDDRTNILFSNGDQYLVASTAITDSLKTQKPAGVMVCGRKVDQVMKAEMRALGGGEVTLTQKEALNSSAAVGLAAVRSGRIRSVSVKDAIDAMTTYLALDINGKSTGAAVIMRSNRSIYHSGMMQHVLMMGLFFALTVINLLVMMVLLHRYVAKPISQLIDSVSGIVPTNGPMKRLVVKGDNELAQLSSSINTLLDNIDESYRQIYSGKEQFSSLVGEMAQGFAVHEVVLDDDGNPKDLRFVYSNDSFKRITGLGSIDITGKRMSELFPDTSQFWIGKLSQVALHGEPTYIDKYVTTSGRSVEINAYRPQPAHCAILMSDVTERLAAEQDLEFMSYHDQLTGLYNRRYFETAMHMLDTPENLPLSVVIGDLNGLKFINDAFGHATGDRLLASAAGMLTQVCRPCDIVARWGGDEFTLLLPHTSSAESAAFCAQIRESIAGIEINSMHCSISMGYETKNKPGENLQLLLRHAEDYMYRSRMKEDISGRGNTIQAIMTTLQERNEREKEHSMRVGRLCRLIAEAMELPYEQATDMELAGLMHDIGKIAISDSIINKRGRLTKEEWAEVKRHPEIGCRILCTSSEMLVIAQYVLAHHERWDGSGYPKGIAGKDIPLQARILAVADSYDAITSLRPYKMKLEMKDAVAELMHCAGKQFDPDVVRAFVVNVLGFRDEDPAEGSSSFSDQDIDSELKQPAAIG